MTTTIDRPALRALAEKATAKPVNGCRHAFHPAEVCREAWAYHDAISAMCAAQTQLGQSGAVVLALLDALEAARADVVKYGEHGIACALNPSLQWGVMQRPRPETVCDCGYAEALARAEGRTDV